MSQVVLASRFDLPFYLRLPSSAYLTWDPEAPVAAVLPRQRLGQVAFSKTTDMVSEDTLLDSPSQLPHTTPGYKTVMVCETKGGRVPTLEIDTGPAGGFVELRPYTEMTVFLVVANEEEARGATQRARVIKVLNHVIALYRLVTQDPWVEAVDPELDLYLVDDAIGVVPSNLSEAGAEDLLMALSSVQFATDIGERRQHTYRLNTLEDLHPGKVLDKPFLDTFVGTLLKPYTLPLHYDLILAAQLQLKRRNYHIAVLEAETAFEVFIADLLLRLKVKLGATEAQVLEDMENPRRLGLLMQRLKAVDAAATEYGASAGLAAWTPFVDSAAYREWRESLYILRNRVVHAGLREVHFDDAKRAIVAAKVALQTIETGLPEFSNRIRIYPGGDHLQNTAGRLRF